jgi:Eco57I restriction-modification methylase
MLPLFGDETAEHLSARVLPDRFRLARDPDDSVAVVRDKERTLARLGMAGTPLSRWKAAADFWCAAWFRPAGMLSPGVYADVVGSLLNDRAALPERHRDALVTESGDLAQRYRFLHWPLEFPEVFFDEHGRRRADGGFDAVIGNPPWDVLRADTGDRRTRDNSRRDRDARLRFFRDAGIYHSQGRGHPNRYQLFLERALQLTRNGGRLGLILPSGLATDYGSSSLRRTLLDSVDVDRLIGFDNRRSIFPIHRDVRFLLLTGTKGSPTNRLTCAFGQSDAEWLDQLPDSSLDDPPAARPIVLSRALLEAWDRDHLAFPLLPGSIDLEILAQASERAPRLSDPAGWGATFGRELNATDDKEHFVTGHGITESRSSTETRHGSTEARRRRASGGQLLTVVEGKHVEPFRLRKDASTVGILRSSAATLLDPDRTFGRRRLAYRDVASSTNRLTLIAALLPTDTVSTHTLFCLKTPLSEASQYCLLALLNSLVANYLVRLQVTTHVTTALMARLPVPRPADEDWQFRALAALARSLEKTGMSDTSAYARLNAIVAHLYQLSTEQYEHVVASFPLLPESLRVACVAAQKEATETQRHRGR